MDTYKQKVQKRSSFRFICGFLNRLRIFSIYSLNRRIARFRGAQIGRSTIIPFALAIKANKNLFIGDDCILETSDIDMRAKVCIKSHCIINKEVQIIRVSHYIDDDTLYTTRYYPSLVIESYSWLATGAKILPSCTTIAKGSVIGAFSICVSNTKEKGVYSGFPASSNKVSQYLI